MIALVLAMVWTRRGQAVTLALLALFAVASAVASPAYLTAVDRAIAAGQIETSVATERGLSITGRVDNRVESESGAPAFANVGAALIELPGFSYVYASAFPTVGLEKDAGNDTQLVFRQDVCAHVRIVSGRCLIGQDDVIVGVRTAQRAGLTAGDPVTMTYAAFEDDPRDPHWEADGIPKRLTVAGTYEVTDPADVYWGAHGYFDAVPGRGPDEPVFTGATTVATMDHGLTDLSIDGAAGVAALDVDRLDALRAGLLALTRRATEIGPNLQVDTGIPALLDRIDAGRASAHLLVPALAVPLVLLACFSIFLAVSYGTQGRQPELAVVALRGSRWWTRWWLATGESLLAILAGAVAGCLAGQLLVNAVAAARFPGVGVDPGFASLRYAPLAAVAALGAAILAQRRQLLSPVASLLRRLPQSNGARALAVEAVVVLLAVVCAVQLAVTDGSLTGVGLLAPAFVMLALSLLAARALVPLVTRYATRALRAGRLGPALAAYQLSRRPGAQRLFALLVATVAVAGYATCAVDVAARGRVVQAELGVGAQRVLEVSPVFRSQLLHAVREVDPEGRFAMAASRLRNSTGTEPLGIAADTTRLAAVATWPGGAPSAEQVVRHLRPDAPAPMVIGGPELVVEATTTGVVKGKELRINVAVSSLTDLGETVVRLGDLREGRARYAERVDLCEDGCRINGLQFALNDNVIGVTGGVTVHSIGSDQPAQVVMDAARWRMPRHGRVSAAPDGLRIDVDAPSGLPDGAWVHPVATPYPLPVAMAGDDPIDGGLTGIDGYPIDVTKRDDLPAVPRAGEVASLVDLEYADRLAVDAAPALVPEVWLNDQAPPDVEQRLTKAGLTVIGDSRAGQVHRRLDRQGPALALWFHVIAGVLAVLLGAFALVLAAAVDRGRRVEDLSALRTQGLPGPTVSRATLWTYPALVGIAAAVGVLTALAGWAVTGWALPLAGVAEVPLPLPAWPRILTLAGVTVLVLLGLAAVALTTGRDLRRRIKP